VPKPFPIIEAFGYAADAATPEASDARTRRWCRFTGTACEKYRQYGYGNCSVTYAAAGDMGTQRTYAVCDHRLDGEPIRLAQRDHFGATKSVLVQEIVLASPRTSFDYVAFEAGNVENIIAIETQAIDIRGGGVGPAWKAWEDSKPEEWRAYFTAASLAENRKDTVAYGVNMANIYKRLGLQVATKGTYLKNVGGVPFYVLMQDRPFEYLHMRIPFETVADQWEITFMTFDYGARQPDGSYDFPVRQVVRTTLDKYVAALSATLEVSETARADFLDRVRRKAGL